MTATTTHAVRVLHRDPAARPFMVIWEVTRACQLVCKHCRADARHDRDPRELSTTQGKALLDDLASFGGPRPMVILTGGDPFERRDLAELVAHGTESGLHMSISPSVTPRLTGPALEELRHAGAHAVSLSLDGADAGAHDAIRGISGVFDATLAAARVVREAGLRLQVNTTVTRSNVLDLPDVLSRVLDMNAGLWSVFFLVPTGRGSQLSTLTADEVEEVLHWLHDVSHIVAVKTTEAPHFRRIALQRAAVPAGGLDAAFPVGPIRARLRAATVSVAGEHRCVERRARPPLAVNAGKGFAFVSHLGEVYPSGFLPLAAGSVHARPFSEIYREAPLLRSLRVPSGFHGRCGRCEFRDVCGGSRSHAYAVYGDPLAEDPTCAYQP